MTKCFVDEALCQAHGDCFRAAPKLFSPSDDGINDKAGKGWFEVPDDQLEEARLAEASCPETAIRVIED